ncbi:MAG: hypothetical protein ACRCYX_07755 [Dermatophilaceae bacterium]
MSAHLWTAVAELTDAAQIHGFTCGREPVDSWLHDRALAARPTVTTRVYLDENRGVVAFAATTMVIVVVAGGTSKQRAGSRDGHSVGYLLAQMGVRSDCANHGIGKAVVKDVMRSATRAHAEAPFPLFVVDAADESLVGYYEQLGLRRLRDTLRLATPMRSVLRWPS